MGGGLGRGGDLLSLSFRMKGMRPQFCTLAEKCGFLLDDNLPKNIAHVAKLGCILNPE